MTRPSFVGARAAQRARLIKTVQTGRAKLGMDDGTYRAMLAMHSAGKNSAKDLTVAELERVLQHLRSAGFTPTKPASARPRERRALDMTAEGRKARAIWLWLHEQGVVRDPSEAALAAWARRVTRVDALQWTGDMHKLIEGLKAWGAREMTARLEQRVEQLKADAVLPAHATTVGVIERYSPTLSPTSFDAIRTAWEELAAWPTRRSSLSNAEK